MHLIVSLYVRTRLACVRTLRRRYVRTHAITLLAYTTLRTYVYVRTYVRTVRTQVDKDFQDWRSKQPQRVDVLEDILNTLYERNPRLGLRPDVRPDPWV